MKVETHDYFNKNYCVNKFLHFFEENQKTLHYLDLTKISQDPQSLRYKKIDLNIDFKIPFFHRSIVTPGGEIYLTGGI